MVKICRRFLSPTLRANLRFVCHVHDTLGPGPVWPPRTVALGANLH